MRARGTIGQVELAGAALSRLATKYQPGAVVECSCKFSGIVTATGITAPACTVTIKEHRSHPEHRLYWAILAWVADNTPEEITRRVGPLTAKAWHEVIKGAAGIESVKFDELDQDAFHAYIEFLGRWLLDVFGVSIDNLTVHLRIEGAIP